ncbi:MAG TPA: DNA methyltransferase, partial [Terriglobia bacterium]|nr:DNA methyltransferase [Terriglobia bacterium]
STLKGGKGFADVWKRGYFGWEYKGKHKDLEAAYLQLNDYREDLENPPLLVVCDQDRFEVHTNFTGTRPRVYSFTLDDLLAHTPTSNSALTPLDVLRAVFTDPEELRPERASARVTEAAAAEFARLALNLEQRGEEPQAVAHFLMRLLFCLFADSIGLLPDHLFRQMIQLDKGKPTGFTRKLRNLFAAMSTRGNTFGMHDIAWFDGGLFADDSVFDLTTADMDILQAASALDWSTVQPAIFGTLFERSFDPAKRSQLGAHYTSPEDILLVIEPVLMAPLEARWRTVKAEAAALAETAKKQKGSAYTKSRSKMQEKLYAWVEELSEVRILDPACGSGNFLYLALRRMLDLWHEVRLFSAQHGLPTILPHQVHPSQLYGIETNVYAHELASVVVWIGYLQWLNDNGIGWPTEPILRKLDNIWHRDAILAHNAGGEPVEADWPKADFVIGNPPFLGGAFLRRELGDEYVDALYRVYEGRIPPQADLVTYWFEKARAVVESNGACRIGLLATQGIRGGINRQVLERIKATGDIFMAWSDENWVLDGAAVHVSIIGFDDGSQTERMLDGRSVVKINPDLTEGPDTTTALPLRENANLCFRADEKGGPFELDAASASAMLAAPMNVNGRPNSDVLFRWINASDITGRPRGMWIIDFYGMTEGQAAEYEKPFEHLRSQIEREHEQAAANGEVMRPRARWWLHRRPGSEMREAVAGLKRYIGTIKTGKHRPFVWLDHSVLPDNALYIFARDDDYFFGVLHSRAHEVWARTLGTQLREAESGFRYTPTSTFETFPFPWPPGREPKDDALVRAIAEAARELVERRDAWLNPPDAKEEDLKERTLTNLYNESPTWLAEAHLRLDAAVFSAYGWPDKLADTEVLERSLALNHERAAMEG